MLTQICKYMAHAGVCEKTGDFCPIEPCPEEEPIKIAPVIHANWEMVDEYCCHAKEFKCTACGGSAYYDHYTRYCDYDFCPNCGAKMNSDD